MVVLGTCLVLPEAASAISVESLFSPGKVIEGHAKYENECSKCHNKFDKNQQTKLCMACHKDVAKDIKNKSGYHGLNKKIRQQECRVCHTDHKGRDIDIIKLDKLTFDHHLTDFKLEGQHRRLECSNCHKEKKKYREAPRDCYSCHKKQSPHDARNLGELARKCHSCHTAENWLKTRYKHKKSSFPFNGKHKKASCAGCHHGDRYSKTPKACISCHKIDDVHGGGNGEKCHKCHSPRGWNKLAFDHDNDTDFPLRGYHKKLRCMQCHKKDPYKVEIKSSCVSCHKHNDTHRGRQGSKCEKCHSESGWHKTKFNHNKDTDFKLAGKHKQVACTACHKSNVFKTELKTDCYSCHKLDDTHNGKQGKRCDKCHNITGWKSKVRFDHDITRFPLIGLHAVAACEECHLSTSYKDASISCLSCHKHDDEHEGKLGEDCQRCHTPNGWKIWRFDHDTQSKFKLTGKHKKQHCYNCHTSAVKKIESSPRTCISCHRSDDEHDGQFGARCDRCHSTKSFREVNIRR
jgi:hypothetical protein